MSSPAASESLQRLSLGEVLAVLAPGAVLILSSLVWIPEANWPRLLDIGRGEQSLLSAASFVLLSYVAGLILSAWSVQGWLLFIGQAQLLSTRSHTTRLLFRIALALLWFFHGWRFALQRGRDVEMRKDLYQYVRSKCGESVSLDVRLFDFFHFFRIVAWDILEAQHSQVLLEGDILYRRRLFCHGCSLAILLAGIQGACRLLQRWLDPTIAFAALDVVLLTLTLGGVFASFLLRAVAFRLLRDEATYTYALFNQGIRK